MALLAALWDWGKLMWADMVSRISGIGSVIAAFAGVYFKWVAENPQPALFWVAGVCFVVATFSVFYHVRPNLDIEIEHVYLDNGFNSDSIKGPHITLGILLTNTREPHNSIKRFGLIVVVTKRASCVGLAEATKSLTLAHDTKPLYDLEADRLSPILQGIGQFGWLRFAFQDDVKGRPFILTVKDAYKREYAVQGIVPATVSSDIEPKVKIVPPSL